MDTHRWGSDGRIANPAFKREQIGRVVRKELTLAELSRELHVEPSVIRRWTHLVDRGSTAVVPAKELLVAQQRIRELERLGGAGHGDRDPPGHPG